MKNKINVLEKVIKTEIDGEKQITLEKTESGNYWIKIVFFNNTEKISSFESTKENAEKEYNYWIKKLMNKKTI